MAVQVISVSFPSLTISSRDSKIGLPGGTGRRSTAGLEAARAALLHWIDVFICVLAEGQIVILLRSADEYREVKSVQNVKACDVCVKTLSRENAQKKKVVLSIAQETLLSSQLCARKNLESRCIF